MKVTTKKGDTGTTTLFNQAGIPKHDPLIMLIGENDEAQSFLGLLKTALTDPDIQAYLTDLQRHIYQMMGELSHGPKVPELLLAQWLTELEKREEALLARTPIGNKFIIPGENKKEAWCHVARTAVRRLERNYSHYAAGNPEVKKFIPFINRLSDYLFILGRSYTV
ncbi:ATP:cob(I)alamin adenosyltransferase [Candidatus Roizmanbacteria bacterium CG10_big_fil_rev_8_21_14_0_10_45_7]|uniref:Corrinoid adenosyltransferase n=1 Tax=Candidatus Roizmanbacteria bacterium CG10_big_fil_rev_8_21_14_0_10_45_7 TaxID=1974854 RepID=A0A2M8KVT1_9BACT|nr:MAG: ATP:cob(I)alamin adenosyltransferase [Candidatus Roizmanbacteria bacterium CG10_big_fil_rev_8_21_14_0_10_45_7]